MILAAALVASLLALAPLGAQEAPSINVAPSFDVVDGQTIRVTAALGVAGSTFSGICTTDTDFFDFFSAAATCDLLGGTNAGPDIDFTASVRAVFTSPLSNREIDCRADQCIVAVATSDFSTVVTAPIDFFAPLSLSPAAGEPGDLIALDVVGVDVDEALVVVCLPDDRCAVIDEAAIDGDRVSATVEIDPNIELDDGSVAVCVLDECRLGFRLIGSNLRDGQVDLVAPFFFAGDLGQPSVELSPSVVHVGDEVQITGLLPNPGASAIYTWCRSDTDFSSLASAGSGCRLPANLPLDATGAVNLRLTPPATVQPFLIGPSATCSPGECVFAIEGSLGAFNVYTAPFTVLPRATMSAVPATDLTDGALVQVDTNTLAAEPGAGALVAQCAFLTTDFSFACGSVGTSIADFDTAAFSGEIAVQRSFISDGVEVECDVNAVCVLVVLVLSPELKLRSRAAQIVSFASHE